MIQQKLPYQKTINNKSTTRFYKKLVNNQFKSHQKWNFIPYKKLQPKQRQKFNNNQVFIKFLLHQKWGWKHPKFPYKLLRTVPYKGPIFKGMHGFFKRLRISSSVITKKSKATNKNVTKKIKKSKYRHLLKLQHWYASFFAKKYFIRDLKFKLFKKKFTRFLGRKHFFYFLGRSNKITKKLSTRLIKKRINVSFKNRFKKPLKNLRRKHYRYRQLFRPTGIFSDDARQDYILKKEKDIIKKVNWARYTKIAKRTFRKLTYYKLDKRLKKKFKTISPLNFKTSSYFKKNLKLAFFKFGYNVLPRRILWPTTLSTLKIYLWIKSAYIQTRRIKRIQHKATLKYQKQAYAQLKKQIAEQKQKIINKKAIKVIIHQSHRYIKKINAKSGLKKLALTKAFVVRKPIKKIKNFLVSLKKKVIGVQKWSPMYKHIIRNLFYVLFYHFKVTSKKLKYKKIKIKSKQTISKKAKPKNEVVYIKETHKISWKDMIAQNKIPKAKQPIDIYTRYNKQSDVIYGSYWIGRFMNMFIRSGLKKKTFNLFIQFYTKVKYDLQLIPLIMFLEVIEKLKPPFRLNGFVIRRTQQLVQFPAMATGSQKYAVVLKWLKREIQKEFYQNTYWHKKGKRYRPKLVRKADTIDNIYMKFFTYLEAPKKHALTKIRSALIIICKEKFYMFRQKGIKRRKYQQTLKF